MAYKYNTWIGKITGILVEGLSITNGDAQGLIDSHPFELAQEWSKGSTPLVAAQRIDKASAAQPE